MAILRSEEIRKLESSEVDKRLGELRLELAKERGNIHIGGTVTSPGRIRELRKTIARILTIKNQKPKENKVLRHDQKTGIKSVKKEVRGKLV